MAVVPTDHLTAVEDDRRASTARMAVFRMAQRAATSQPRASEARAPPWVTIQNDRQALKGRHNGAARPVLLAVGGRLGGWRLGDWVGWQIPPFPLLVLHFMGSGRLCPCRDFSWNPRRGHPRPPAFPLMRRIIVRRFCG